MNKFKQLFITLITGLISSLAISQVDLSDVGQVYLENTGAESAQQDFLHGLAQMHNFEYEFAAEDFRKAQQLDPDFALAYWGEAMTYNHPIWMEQDKEAALGALNRFASTPAARQDRAQSQLEKDLMAAADVLYGAGSKEEQDDLYMEYMGELNARYPDNVEVASLYALAIMGTAHEGREFGLYMQSAALMSDFIRDYPRHPGVAHYMIHATDDPTHAPLGLNAANAYGGIAPDAGHAQHMTTHIFLALGDWEGVIRANVRASEIVDNYRATQGRGPVGCGHYTSWLMYGYLQNGNRDEAHAIMNLCYKNVLDGTQPLTATYSWQRALYLLDTDEWDGDVAAMTVDSSEAPYVRLQDHIVDGWVAIKNGKATEASMHLSGAQTTYQELLEMRAAESGESEPGNPETMVSLKQLESQIALAEGNSEDALSLLHEAVAIEMDMPFGFGPPQPAKPSLELLGETLVELGHYEEARKVLRQNLSRTPNKAVSVAALARAEAALSSGD